MSRVSAIVRSRRVPQIAVLALTSIGFAGCSADTSTRFTQNGYTSPVSNARGAPEATGSVTPQYASSGVVESRPLPQYTRPAYSPQYSSSAPPAIAPAQSYPSAAGVSGGGGRGIGSYTPPARPIETTSSVAPRSVAAAPAPGITIIVGTSDSLDGLARRYNVSAAAILQANRLAGPRALQPGQQLIIPRQSVAARSPAPAPAPAPVAAPALAAAPAIKPVAAAPEVHVVNRGDTLNSIARRHHMPVAELARANNLSPTAPLKIGARINVPGKTAAGTAPAAPVQAAPVQVATAEPAAKAMLANPAPTGAELSPAKAAETTSGLPTFRWPVRGRVITTYGAKTNGKQNDGINVAVPEGTPVKAAEDGVVAYSGNELKGYGNLVLIRHSNGYVTAYAHASELLVKRGDTIKRGQVIAKSGQTGEVGSPQLHFEIRKGASPVDPLQFLNGA